MKYLALLTVLLVQVTFCTAKKKPLVDKYNVIWNSPSNDSWGSMPVGNGDIGSNVWVTPDGVLHFYISKTDAFSENGRLLKIGKASIRFTPNILNDKSFRQELDLYSGAIKISTDKVKLDVRVDANNPLIIFEGESKQPVKIEVSYDGWRNKCRVLEGPEQHSARGLMGSPDKIIVEADTLLNNSNSLLWCHHNKRSVWPMVLDRQYLGELKEKQRDPLLHRTFGAMIYGDNLVNTSNKKLKSKAPSQKISVKIITSTTLNTGIDQWVSDMKTIQQKEQSSSSSGLVKKHIEWWNRIWDQHYILVDSDTENETAFTVTQSYLLQRYMNACSGRGNMPIKFNGSIFNVDIPCDYHLNKGNLKGTDADFRQWGGCYWFQNTRLPYWGMLYSGDFDLMKPLFNMYKDALDLARFRSQKYHRHRGVCFPETMYFFGAYSITDYGWDRGELPAGETKNQYIRYYWQSGIELVAMMQDYYLFTEDKEFLNADLAEMAKEVLFFYDEHYPKNEAGVIEFSPAHSLETFFHDVVNPLPEIAGLKHITQRFLANKENIKDDELIGLCEKIESALPEIPLRVDKDGNTIIAPAQKYNPKTSNFENPELYAIFPYTLYGLGKEDPEMARKTYEKRIFKEAFGWQQDAIQAALVGKTEEARNIVVAGFKANHKGSRFPGFWGPNYDWIPDQDHGSVNVRALQNMLIQEAGDSILLCPAWPKEWNVDFKLHAPQNTVIEGRLKNGKIEKLRVTPKSRRKDIIIMK